MSDSPGNSMFSPDISPTSMGTTLLTPTAIVSFASGIPTCTTTSARMTSTKSLTSPITSTSTVLTASISGGSKNQTATSSSESSSSHNSLSVVQSSPQNLSVVSGNVVISHPQSILQTPNNSALLYHTGQGLVYATPTNLPDGVVLNLGQEQGGTQQQYITIPVSLSLTPAQQQQLIQGQATSQNSTYNSSSSSRKDKSRK